jgi:adenylosuccinate lyase
MFDAVRRACILTGDMLERVNLVASSLTLHPSRMRTNLNLTGGGISAEAVMLELGGRIGRQNAHEIVYEAAQEAATNGRSFAELLATDARVAAHLTPKEITTLLDPTRHTGLSAVIAHNAAAEARALATRLDNWVPSASEPSAEICSDTARPTTLS